MFGFVFALFIGVAKSNVKLYESWDRYLLHFLCFGGQFFSWISRWKLVVCLSGGKTLSILYALLVRHNGHIGARKATIR
jgi:hypothetical protein